MSESLKVYTSTGSVLWQGVTGSMLSLVHYILSMLLIQVTAENVTELVFGLNYWQTLICTFIALKMLGPFYMRFVVETGLQLSSFIFYSLTSGCYSSFSRLVAGWWMVEGNEPKNDLLVNGGPCSPYLWIRDLVTYHSPSHELS